MYDYVSLRIDANPCSETITDLVADSLCEIGFESFEPDDKGLTAYIRKDQYDRIAAEEALQNFPITAQFTYSERTIIGEDWNREWEQNYYQPILIDGQCVVRSTFHKNAPSAPLEVLIDPKMAFGTGHHATTAGMIRLIMKSDMEGRRVIDIGTGTGILAILSKKLGAKEVSAIEIDPYALENAEENGLINKVHINWICGDASALQELEKSDYLLANINLNVILSDIDKYLMKLRPGGQMLLSGFYEKDFDIILKRATSIGMEFIDKIIDNEWVAVKFIKR